MLFYESAVIFYGVVGWSCFNDMSHPLPKEYKNDKYNEEGCMQQQKGYSQGDLVVQSLITCYLTYFVSLFIEIKNSAWKG